MDDAWKEFLGIHTLIFSFICWVGTFFVRRIVENIWPHLKKQADENSPNATYLTPMSRWWNQVILYLVPVVLGAGAAAVATAYPFPAGIQSLSARLFFGTVIGFFSGYLYKVVRQIVARVTGVQLEGASAPPGPGSMRP